MTPEEDSVETRLNIVLARYVDFGLRVLVIQSVMDHFALTPKQCTCDKQVYDHSYVS